jgi:phosphate transport system substrate-binding protein
MLSKKIISTAALLAGLFYSNQILARDYIQIVGSSTVYPFTTVIAEDFHKSTKFKTPIVESTGTGGGFKLFCSGVGEKFPDFVNASRKIEKSEIIDCNKNGIKSIIEIKLGYDGIVLANSNKSQPINLTKKQIFLALADKIPAGGKLVKNPYSKWSDIDKSLPAKEITVYGPPTTSGTRDAFVELVLEKACMEFKEFTAAYPDEKARKKACHTIRTDNKFIEAGENDNLIVQKLKNNSDAIGIFGFSFLAQNASIIQAAKINGVQPSFENVFTGKYEVARPLFIYFKKEHLTIATGSKEFIRKIVDPNTSGEEGYLIKKGLIPMHSEEFRKSREKVLGSL